MLKKFLISCCLLLTQFLPLTMNEANAQTPSGYTSWNDYVSKSVGCGQNNTSCSVFKEGKKIYMTGYGVCTWNENSCLSSTPYFIYGNDPYALLGIVSSFMNPYYARISNYQLSITDTTTQMSPD